VSTYAETQTLLQSLKLKGAARSLDALLEAAQSQEMSFADFLHQTLQAELTDRAERRLTRNLTASHLPVEKRLEDFDFSRLAGVTKSEAMNLLDFRWIDLHENLVFFGPPGLGNYVKQLLM
jgi:DNA replication protein DnaC